MFDKLFRKKSKVVSPRVWLGRVASNTWVGKEAALASLTQGIMGADGRYADPLGLARHQSQVYSQNGEDGIIAEAFRRIGTRDRFFVEIGIGDGQENNTRFLLEQGWRGVWVEGSAEFAQRARDTFAQFIASGHLRLVESLVTAETISALLQDAGVPQEFDFLSLDIDQNTSHVWRALTQRARVVCIEYNASLPAAVPLEVPYDPSSVWDGSNWFGASLKALEQIGTSKQMNLVGCDALGINAFFVASPEADASRFRAPFTAEHHFEPPRYSVVGHAGHPASRVARRWLGGTP